MTSVTPDTTNPDADHRRAAARAYYATHKAACNARSAANYRKNKAAIIARQRVYQRERYANDPAWRAKQLERQRLVREKKRAERAHGVEVAA